MIVLPVSPSLFLTQSRYMQRASCLTCYMLRMSITTVYQQLVLKDRTLTEWDSMYVSHIIGISFIALPCLHLPNAFIHKSTHSMVPHPCPNQSCMLLPSKCLLGQHPSDRWVWQTRSLLSQNSTCAQCHAMSLMSLSCWTIMADTESRKGGMDKPQT